MPNGYHEITSVWKGGVQYAATAASGAVTYSGGPGDFSAMDTLLIALAGCTGADVASILEKKRQPLTGIEIKVRGEKAAEHPKKFTSIEILFTVTGHGLDPEAVQRAIELSETKYCSVAATVSGVAKVHTRFEVREAEPIVSSPQESKP